jgi:hypothetical protein
LTVARLKETAAPYLAEIYDRFAAEGVDYSRMPPPIPAIFRQARAEILAIL